MLKNKHLLVILLGVLAFGICSWVGYYHYPKPILNIGIPNVPNSSIWIPQEEFSLDDYIFGKPINQSDPRLVSAFKRVFLVPPPPHSKPERSVAAEIKDDPGHPTTKEKIEWIKKLLIENPDPKQRVTNGFYMELGANDGSFISTTITLEKMYNWTGLLIEANPIPFKQLLEKKRNVYAANVAACITENPRPVKFYANPVHSGLSGFNLRLGQREFQVWVNLTVQCIPLYTMMAALEVKSVDYLSLDVERYELEILKTVPFDKVSFKVMTIEHWSIRGGEKALIAFLEPKGYRFVKILKDPGTLDSLFVYSSLYESAMKIKDSIKAI